MNLLAEDRTPTVNKLLAHIVSWQNCHVLTNKVKQTKMVVNSNHYKYLIVLLINKRKNNISIIMPALNRYVCVVSIFVNQWRMQVIRLFLIHSLSAFVNTVYNFIYTLCPSEQQLLICKHLRLTMAFRRYTAKVIADQISMCIIYNRSIENSRPMRLAKHFYIVGLRTRQGGKNVIF